MKKDIIVAVMLTFCLTATLFMIARTQSQEYDPWADLNGDGKIDILDVTGMTGKYATTGDPTKNVNVTNWPPTKERTVYFRISSSSGSSNYNVSGYSQMRLAYRVGLLAGAENVTISIFGMIYEEGGPGAVMFRYRDIIITSTKDPEGTMDIPIATEIMAFYVTFSPGATLEFTMSFYLVPP